MKIMNSRRLQRRAAPRLAFRHVYFYRLQQIDQIDNFIGVIRFYVHKLWVRKLVSSACMGSVPQSKEPELFNRGRTAFIGLRCRVPLKDGILETKENFQRDIASVSSMNLFILSFIKAWMCILNGIIMKK